MYPLYLYWLYYIRDKDVIIHVNYIGNNFEYIKGGKVLLSLNTTEIDKIEKHNSRYIGMIFWHFKIFLKQGECIIITSLVMPNAHNAFPNVKKRESYRQSLFIPRSWSNIVKL